MFRIVLFVLCVSVVCLVLRVFSIVFVLAFFPRSVRLVLCFSMVCFSVV